ncbi:MAG TPA: amylo-alpha-1,6-glucosidase [Polyangia bacterium]|nr:amylo-alpha-1,6-glucosidase [Polyangia bacterium]
MNAPEQIPTRWGWRQGELPDALFEREWLVTNGLGGFASGTAGGIPTRRSHGLLVASLPAPLGRILMLNHLLETLAPADEAPLVLSGIETLDASSPAAVEGFRIENGRPVWTFARGGVRLEKRIVVSHQQNTARIVYRLTAADRPVRLALEPALAIRPHEGRVDQPPGAYTVHATGDGVEVKGRAELPALRLLARAARPVGLGGTPRKLELIYRTERDRGYDWQGTLRTIGTFTLDLTPGEEASFTASTEDWNGLVEVSAAESMRLDDERRLRLIAQAAPALRTGPGAELVLAADQFVISPRVRPTDDVRLRAEGDEARTIIAGYPWFTDWGRDTMISLEGLTLLTGRASEARSILHTFAQHVRDGLIPNLFPEGETEGLYHTADATLWFFHALDRYERATGDVETRRFLLPKLVEIVNKHLQGTRFGIGLDTQDGLLTQGEAGYQLTWMDAKVGDWVVTPRRGKAVEINALFYNALMLLSGWLAEAGQRTGAGGADVIAAHADRLRTAFNRRFWNPATGCLFDVVDGEPDDKGARDDASVRPNQLLAISLPNPVLDPAHWPQVMGVVREQLATPFGLRSLAPGHPDYKPRYDGDLRTRDAAYHQGTIWGWLIGPFVDAWLKTFPDDREGARRLLDGLGQELSAACIGTISEIYDADPPFAPRGCVAQAWSVAEALRALAITTE